MKAIILSSIMVMMTGISVNGSNRSYKNNPSYITDPNDFIAAVQRGESKIYVGDITFQNESPLAISYPVEIIGKEDKSILQKAHFVLNGTNLIDQLTKITFSNIIFDGMIEKEDYDFSTPKLAFSSIFGNDRTDKRCFNDGVGYYDFSLSNCDIKRYASYNGPAMFFTTDEVYRSNNRKVNIDKCNFYDNIAVEGTLCLGYEKCISSITNSRFYNNLVKNVGGPSVANGEGKIDKVKVDHNEFYHFLNENYVDDTYTVNSRIYNAVNRSGSLYFGSCSGAVSNCEIFDNKTYFGGGIGFSTPVSKADDFKMLFSNLNILNNQAEFGGAIYGQCVLSNNVKFINCNILSNKANKNGLIYITSVNPSNNATARGGVLDFIFSTIAENIGNESNPQLIFEEAKLPAARGTIDMHGCFAVDESNYTPKEGQYNYFANKVTAITENVTTNEDLLNCVSKGLSPIKGSKADVEVKKEIYSDWDDSLKGETGNKKIGYTKYIPVVPTNNNLKKTLIILIPCLVVLIAILVVTTLFYRKKKLVLEDRDINEKLSHYTFDTLLIKITPNLESLNLTKKECEVATCLLLCNKRKEIADKLFVSEDTVKTHISHIFKKIKVSSKEEFKHIISKYL